MLCWFGGGNRFRRTTQSLIHAINQPTPKAPRQSCTGLTHQITYPAQAQPGELRGDLRFQPERCDGQGCQCAIGLSRWCDPQPRPGFPKPHIRRGTPLGPVPPFARAGPRGAGLLIDRIAVAVRAHLLPGIARQRPGSATRVGQTHLHRQSHIGAIVLHHLHQRRLPTKKMRTTGQVYDQPGMAFLSHPRGELARPTTQHGEKLRLC